MLNFRKMRYDVSPFPRGDDFRKPAPETEIAIGKWIRKPAKCKFALGARWKGKPIVWVPKGRMPKHLWFVGDIHGDILALETIIQTVNKETPGASIVFLGDMFDRHPYGYEVVIRLLELMKEKPGRILWIAGNHDVSLKFENGMFYSDCTPSEFADFLNGRRDLQEFGKWLIHFIQGLPRALFLPGGLVCSHGGVPHTDVQDSLSGRRDLYRVKALNDFTWSRVHLRAPFKQVNRTVLGGELGSENVLAFFRKMSVILKYPVKYLVCGHQHPDDKGKGFKEVSGIPALILNSSFFSENMFSPSPWLIPCIARYKKNKLPEVFPLELKPEECTRFYGTSNQG